MIIEIDQSGKVEDTSVDTVIGAANKTWKRTLRLPAVEKRKLQKVFRAAGKTGTYSYRVFAAIIYLALNKELSDISELVIDEEYTNQDDIIRLFLTRIMRTTQYRGRAPHISFKRIGRRSPAHDAAYLGFIKKRPVDRIVKAQDVLKLLF